MMIRLREFNIRPLYYTLLEPTEILAQWLSWVLTNVAIYTAPNAGGATSTKESVMPYDTGGVKGIECARIKESRPEIMYIALEN